MKNIAVNETHIRAMRHCIGLDYKNPYRGNYKPYRNYCVYNAPNYIFEYLVKYGLAEITIEENEHYIPKVQYYYRLTRAGMDFIGRIIGAKIEEEEG